MAHLRDLCIWESDLANQKSDGIIDVKKYKEPRIRVNICWQVGEEKKCVTLSKEQAYATREWVEKNNGVVFWFQALPD
jgi:hypothetical protein